MWDLLLVPLGRRVLRAHVSTSLSWGSSTAMVRVAWSYVRGIERRHIRHQSILYDYTHFRLSSRRRHLRCRITWVWWSYIVSLAPSVPVILANAGIQQIRIHYCWLDPGSSPGWQSLQIPGLLRASQWQEQITGEKPPKLPRHSAASLYRDTSRICVRTSPRYHIHHPTQGIPADPPAPSGVRRATRTSHRPSWVRTCPSLCG